MSYNIKEMVKDGKNASFQYYRKGELWYKTECGFMFPVPVSDVGDGTFNASEKAMLLMRYIRKQVEAHAQEDAVTTVRDANDRLQVMSYGEVIGTQG